MTTSMNKERIEDNTTKQCTRNVNLDLSLVEDLNVKITISRASERTSDRVQRHTKGEALTTITTTNGDGTLAPISLIPVRHAGVRCN